MRTLSVNLLLGYLDVKNNKPYNFINALCSMY